MLRRTFLHAVTDKSTEGGLKSILWNTGNSGRNSLLIKLLCLVPLILKVAIGYFARCIVVVDLL